jgi:hypothetical protein
MGEMKNSYKIVFGNLEGNRSVGRYNHRWKNNIKINIIKYEA